MNLKASGELPSKAQMAALAYCVIDCVQRADEGIREAFGGEKQDQCYSLDQIKKAREYLARLEAAVLLCHTSIEERQGGG